MLTVHSNGDHGTPEPPRGRLNRRTALIAVATAATVPAAGPIVHNYPEVLAAIVVALVLDRFLK